jgi:hypothetical protein
LSWRLVSTFVRSAGKAVDEDPVRAVLGVSGRCGSMTRRLAAVLGLMAVLVACTAHDAKPPSVAVRRVGAVPLAVPGSFGPGTKIADGFTVAPGSSLLAGVFPPVTADRTGWQAFLFVTGDPLVVVQNYADQAARLGFPTLSQRFVHGVCGGHATESACQLVAGGAKGLVEIDLQRAVRPRPMTQLHLSYTVTSGSPPPTETLTWGTAPTVLAPAWRLPAPGVPLGTPTENHGWKVTLPDSSQAVAPSGPGYSSIGGFSAVALLGDDGSDAISHFARQLRPHGDYAKRSFTWRGHPVTVVSGGAPDDLDVYAVVVRDGPHPRLLVLGNAG